jgi:DNA repair protein RadC
MPALHAFHHLRLIREGALQYHAPIATPLEAVQFFQQQLGNDVQERFAALYLNARNAPLGWREISRGSVSASIVHPREVFAPALRLAASSLILAHNHPSGDPSPSKEDLELSRRLRQVGELLGMEVLDHLIITATTHVSLKERNLL